MNANPVAWTALPAVQHRLNFLSSGRSDIGWHAYCLSLLDPALLGRARMLVLGDESRWIERDLAGRNVFERCDVAELGDRELPASEYDAVWCDRTLCRTRELERDVDQIARCLRPGGLLFAYEYVGTGPALSGRAQRAAAQAAFSLVPRRYRIATSSGVALTKIDFPLDAPDENAPPAVSHRVVGVLRERFEFACCRPLGGTLLQYVLKDIAGNFCANDSMADSVLAMLFAVEDALIGSGELESDFTLIVGKPK